MATPTTPLFVIKRATARQIAEQLKTAGIPVHEVSEPNEDVDGEIAITDFVHVQVGYDDCSVGIETSEEAFIFYEPVTSLEQLINDIRTGIEEARIDRAPVLPIPRDANGEPTEEWLMHTGPFLLYGQSEDGDGDTAGMGPTLGGWDSTMKCWSDSNGSEIEWRVTHYARAPACPKHFAQTDAPKRAPKP